MGRVSGETGAESAGKRPSSWSEVKSERRKKGFRGSQDYGDDDTMKTSLCTLPVWRTGRGCHQRTQACARSPSGDSDSQGSDVSASLSSHPAKCCAYAASADFVMPPFSACDNDDTFCSASALDRQQTAPTHWHPRRSSTEDPGERRCGRRRSDIIHGEKLEEWATWSRIRGTGRVGRARRRSRSAGFVVLGRKMVHNDAHPLSTTRGGRRHTSSLLPLRKIPFAFSYEGPTVERPTLSSTWTPARVLRMATSIANPGPAAEILDWPGLLQLWKNKSPAQALPTYVPTYVPAPHAGVEPPAHPASRRRRRLQYALFTTLTLLLCILVLRWLSTIGAAGAGVDSNLVKNATALEAPHAAAAAPAPSKEDASAGASFIQSLETSTILELAGISGFIGNVLFVLSGRNKKMEYLLQLAPAVVV
ncbi:hypothetical protein HMN09_01116800 [Mycena chlorophos]|uniref:Uncharacterized protein n=1 Tax=Mycena chlorophos TaxID=658473 RepID=A0A8H6SA21_MYCCL|nr:hypothetical protein HMN09_01116800 [Mycena chlorophos]